MKLLLQANFLFLMSLLCVVFEVECDECERPIFKETKPFHHLKSTPEQLTDARETYLAGSSILYGLLKKLNESFVTDICKEHLQVLYNGINRKEVWAMKVLDSSAQLQPGFIFGNNFLLGSFQECESFKESHTVTLSSRFVRNMKTNLIDTVGPFDLEYNVVYSRHDSPWQIEAEFHLTDKILQVGLCLPKSCSLVDVWNISQNYFDEETFGFASIYESQPKVLEVKTLEVKANFFNKISVQLMGAFVLITLLLTMMANILQRDSDNSASDVIGNSDSTNGHRTSLLTDLVKCYSIKDNYEFLISTKSSPDTVPTVNALRSIGSFGILVGHMIYFSHFSVHNPIMMFSQIGKFPVTISSPFFVEMYFTISGLLLLHNLLKNQQNIILFRTNSFWQNLKLLSKILLHRYLRLTPLFLFAIGCAEISFAYLHQTSPFWIKFRLDLMCSSYWWRHVLYIHNFYTKTEHCLTWTWTSDCEMQYTIFFTLLIFLYAKNPELSKKIFISLFAAFTLIKYYVLYKIQFGFTMDVISYTADEMYTPPWMRIIPYFIGVGSGWMLLNCKHILDKKPTKYLFLVAVLTIITIHYNADVVEIAVEYAVPLLIVTRIVYSSAIAVLILASASKNIIPTAKLLNQKIFVHLNKLSYSIFLLHPIVISMIFGLRDDSYHSNTITLIIMPIGIYITTYLLGFVSSLLFEMPYAKLSILLKNYKSNKVL